ncbi:hypothetical protein JTE90_005413 [Oedothorax gibbosus]|uniref:Kazal-like domain-containing protein n=1 Tax=Oedothorax gibbosus TaxID=931172 RepID=A0AAV6UNN4_9ARAC|nr:hypothetical protein JTE90_005413 [Oedothorax gibbosus]
MGLSYMDDNAKKRDSPMYFTVAVGLLFVGPSLGVMMSSICLKYFENPFDDPGYGPDDPCWVGAWWIGFVIQGLLLLLVTIPIFMFPKSLPGFKKPVDRNETNTANSFSDVSAAVKRIVLNPLLWAILMDGVASTYWTIGHKVVLPRYMEDQFRLTTSDANFYSDVPGTGAVLLGAALGGFVIWKIRPPMKALLVAMIVLKSLAGCGYLALMEPKCDKIEMANFGMENGSLILDGSCNMNCNCTRKSFTPVCGSDLKTVYFSPCYAGCEQSFNETFFNNCSCIIEPSSLESYTTEGFCTSETCWIQALAYIIASPTIQFLMNILMVMQLLMLLRCTQPQDKSLALGLFVALKSIPGIVPSLILLGPMLDPACLIWEHSSDKSGNCWFYDTDKFSKALHGTSAGFSFLSAATLGLIFGLRGRFCDLYEENNDYEELRGDTKETQIVEIDRSLSIQDSDDSYEAPPKMSLDRVISCRICLKYD